MTLLLTVFIFCYCSLLIEYSFGCGCTMRPTHHPERTGLQSWRTDQKCEKGSDCSKHCGSPFPDCYYCIHPTESILAFSSDEGSYRSSLYGRNLRTGTLFLYTKLKGNAVQSMDYDAATERWFYLNTENKVYLYETRSDSHCFIHSFPKDTSPRILRIDWITKNIYFASDHEIQVCNFRKVWFPYCSTIVTETNGIINDLILSPNSRHIFWNLRDNKHGYVYRSNMDGSNKFADFVPSVAGGHFRPEIHFLTMDHVNNTLYWFVNGGSFIESSKKYINTNEIFNYYSKPIIHRNNFYFYNNDEKSLGKCNLNSNYDCTLFSYPEDKKFRRIENLVILDKANQPTGNNYCNNNGGCKEICLPLQNGHTCI